jgi:hypothetical protein
MRIKIFEDEPLVAFPNVLSSLVFTERDRTMRIRGRSATGAVPCGRPVLTRSVKEWHWPSVVELGRGWDLFVPTYVGQISGTANASCCPLLFFVSAP